ncbi:MAG: sigma-70 family RNA polymerase sigma factor [Rhodothermales bacterium]|nr:sigma-70 family RNA polymerase sigma factor [Rhodothermales bacterium]
MDTSQITQLLDSARDGDDEALHKLLPIVYDELRKIARSQRRKSGSETLNTTAIVHEAYEKLAKHESGWADRTHFFRVAAKAMRDVVVDYARRQNAAKRGSGVKVLDIDALPVISPERTDEILALDEALDRLAELDARQGEVVQLRYFVGLTIAETADVLGLSSATIKREWVSARAWLHREMRS